MVTHWDYWRKVVTRLIDRLKSLEVFDKGRCNDCFLLVERVYNSRSKSAVQISYFPKYIPLFFMIITNYMNRDILLRYFGGCHNHMILKASLSSELFFQNWSRCSSWEETSELSGLIENLIVPLVPKFRALRMIMIGKCKIIVFKVNCLALLHDLKHSHSLV